MGDICIKDDSSKRKAIKEFGDAYKKTKNNKDNSVKAKKTKKTGK